MFTGALKHHFTINFTFEHNKIVMVCWPYSNPSESHFPCPSIYTLNSHQITHTILYLRSYSSPPDESHRRTNRNRNRCLPPPCNSNRHYQGVFSNALIHLFHRTLGEKRGLSTTLLQNMHTTRFAHMPPLSAGIYVL